MMKRFAFAVAMTLATLALPTGISTSVANAATPDSSSDCYFGSMPTTNIATVKITSTLRVNPVYPGDPSCGMIYAGHRYYVYCAAPAGNGWVWAYVRGAASAWGWVPITNLSGSDQAIPDCRFL